MLFGIRVSLSDAHGMSYPIDYCCGTDGTMINLVFHLLRAALLGVDEGLSSGEIERMFPRQTVKPIDNEPEILSELSWLAVLSTEQAQSLEPIDQQWLQQELSQRFAQRYERLSEFREKAGFPA